jgi:hypothetical protein
VKAAWQHFVSWWVYPVVATGTTIFVALLIVQPHSDALLLLFRLFLFGGFVAWMYDVRRRRAGATDAVSTPARTLSSTRFVVIILVVGGGWFLLGRLAR